MGWINGGFLATWYAAFAALYVRSLGQGDTNALLLAFGHFVCVPILLLGACGAVADIPARTAAVDGAMHAGRLGRWGAFLAGAGGALGSMVVVGLLGGAAMALGEAGWVPIIAMPIAPMAGLYAAAHWAEWFASGAEPPAAPEQPLTSSDAIRPLL